MYHSVPNFIFHIRIVKLPFGISTTLKFHLYISLNYKVTLDMTWTHIKNKIAIKQLYKRFETRQDKMFQLFGPAVGKPEFKIRGCSLWIWVTHNSSQWWWNWSQTLGIGRDWVAHHFLYKEGGEVHGLISGEKWKAVKECESSIHTSEAERSRGWNSWK